jgi:hypothetical protein
MVALAALVLRLVVAWWSEKIPYPDELFQYLEQAHRLVYGYGFVPWEYRFGVRNWLLPGALAALLETLRIFGLAQPAVYIPVIKSILSVVSVVVVYASYAIGRNLFSEQAGRIAAVFSAVWYELLSYATVPTPEVLGAYASLAALALATGPRRDRYPALIGLLLGLAVALRLQYALSAAAIGAVVLLTWGWRPVVLLAACGAAVLLAAGLLDAWTWGTAFVSYYNAVLFNIVHGVGGLFGQQPFVWYFLRLLFASGGLHIVALVSGAVAWRQSWPILLVVAGVLAPHMLLAHKEYRFVFLVVPLLMVLLAHGATVLVAWLATLEAYTVALGGLAVAAACGLAFACMAVLPVPAMHMLAIHNARRFALLGAPLLLVPALLGLAQLFSALSARHIRALVMLIVALVSVIGCVAAEVLKREDRLLATLDLARRADVAAVVDLTGPWWESGAFYYLHKDIPFCFEGDVQGLPAGGIASVASHVLVRHSDPTPAGFRVVAVHGTIKLLESETRPASLRRLAKDCREPAQEGVDGRFLPTVRRRY